MQDANQLQTIELLKKLYLRNCDDAVFYRNNSMLMKRILFKVFFERLGAQKATFCNGLKILILDRLNNSEEFSFNHVKSEEPNKLFLNLYRKRVLKECIKREKIALNSYCDLLKINTDQDIIHVLSTHKKEIQSILQEMRIMGVDKYTV